MRGVRAALYIVASLVYKSNSGNGCSVTTPNLSNLHIFFLGSGAEAAVDADRAAEEGVKKKKGKKAKDAPRDPEPEPEPEPEEPNFELDPEIVEYKVGLDARACCTSLGT